MREPCQPPELCTRIQVIGHSEKYFSLPPPPRKRAVRSRRQLGMSGIGRDVELSAARLRDTRVGRKVTLFVTSLP